MKSAELTEALRRARPAVPSRWSSSPEGCGVLAGVLATPREAAPIAARRRSAKPLLAGAVAVLVAVGVLVSTQLIADRGADVGRQIPGVDTYRAADVAFFEQFRFDGPTVHEVENYRTMEAAASAASAVIVGEVVGIHDIRAARGTGSGDRPHWLGLHVRPVEVLRGELPAAFAKQVTVEFDVGLQPAMAIVERAVVPLGKQVWFLRSKAEDAERAKEALAKQGRKPNDWDLARFEDQRPYYRLTSSEGLFLQCADRVVCPVASKVTLPANTMTAEGERYRYLSELIEAIRAGR